MENSGKTNSKFPIGKSITIPGHFPEPVILESVRTIGAGYECRVRLSSGVPDETILSIEEGDAIFSIGAETIEQSPIADAEQVRLLVESTRIRLAYAHDPQFAVSLSGIRTLPHQIEAVYMKMLPQPRLRFLLADDPGAGKTIMAGLLLKELKLRQAIERILILCPAPLTIQWQDELLQWFGESFDIICSAVDQKQLINPWQKSSQIISSVDYAKQEGVRERVWQQKWDMVIIDEAHKCSAYSRHYANKGNDVEKTKRYQLAEHLTRHAGSVLLLTATPHHGDEDRFAHFIRLLDADLFPEPHRMNERSSEIRTNILRLGPECPWALRRLKEDLKDVNGHRLFPDRHAITVAFQLNRDEYDLYKSVTGYINRFLPQATGRKKASVALARTVFQRRLASSTFAIFESIRRRRDRQEALLKELEGLPPNRLSKRLAQLQGTITDIEQDEDDLEDDVRDRLVDEVSAAIELDHLRDEIAALKELQARAEKVNKAAGDTKLEKLKSCLNSADFHELKDGRGKLLIFTEHKDTLFYLVEKLEEWGYSTCQIHGGMNPHDRKRAQEKFRIASQVCVATEAAGEGINLQFCHLMINYDLPWNPTRLEQRLGRIHRIGQTRDVYAYNFVASESEEGQPIIEGRILQRLLMKLEQMRDALADRIFDVIGEVLTLNEVNLPEMLRDAAHDPRRLDEYLDRIEKIDPIRLKAYEDATGIALARATVDFSSFQRSNTEAEERRLMPKYVEQHFIAACKSIRLKIAQRADGLWRIDHVLADLRSERLSAVRRMGKPETHYRKITFHKEHLNQNQHLDAILVGPGHPLYAAVDERVNEMYSDVIGKTAIFIDPASESLYRLYFFEMTILGQDQTGATTPLHAELVAVKERTSEDPDQKFAVVSSDCLLDLPAHPTPPDTIPAVDPTSAADYLKVTYQMDARRRCQQERQRYVTVCREYLEQSFDARIRAAMDRVMQLRARESANPEMALARQRSENDLEDLKRTRQERMEGLGRLSLARHGPLRHIATAMVFPPDVEVASLLSMELDPAIRRRSEQAAEDVVIAYEEARGWTCERVGHQKIGFDIRSIGPADPTTGYRDPVTGIRRIEVKGRMRGQAIRLTTNEWCKAVQLGDSYWLYVVWDPLDNPGPEPVRIQNPAKHLDYARREVVAARFFDIPAEAIEKTFQQIQAGRNGIE